MVNLALIGLGYWGKNHFRVFKELVEEGAIETLTLCDSDEKRARAFAKNEFEYVTDYRKLLNNKQIDAVDIVTPSSTHYRIANDFLEHGKDILVEKPLTLSSKIAEKLIKIAERKKLILMPGHIFRYHPCIQKLKEMIGRKEFGKIHYMTSNRLAFAKPRKDMGVLFALGIHEVDLFSYLLNQDYPTELTAFTYNYLQTRVEDFAYLTLKFRTDITCSATESWLSPSESKERTFTVVGSKKAAKIDYLTFEFQLFDLDRKNFKTAKGSIVVEQKEPLKEELKDFVDCVKSKKKPLADMYCGKRAIEIVELALRSAKEQRTIKLKRY